jgi:maltose alpha-D-glucosyltransferase / alpha-amylase
MQPYWYKEAIIYELHVKCFYDSSNDGVGDFKGLTQKLDYIQDLGVTAIWLLPFYPSPLKDDGYDISNYVSVHPLYGELKDFRAFLRQAHKRGLKVITELVINHTSDQHPWFQRARRAGATQQERDFYVWSKTPEKYTEARIIFQDFEPSNWTWDREAQSYFWHRFYSHQPDLNFDNLAVHQAVLKNLGFWLKMGVDGVRLDAVPYLYEREGTTCENLPETHAFLKKMRKYVDEHFKDKMLLAEANQWPEDAAKYFGEGDECQMAFHFPVMPRLFMAIHLEDSLPIIEIMEQTPEIPASCQWALFLRNHDELTLEMVTDEERDYMFRVYAYDKQARVNLGIRRRLAPLLRNDRRKIELMNVLLFSLEGTPVLYYGDEIGMGDNIYLGDRNGVRTPMQWNGDKNAGFSRTNPQQLFLPPIIDPEYHYETVNVEAQRNNHHSLFWWTKQLIALRKRFKAFSYGTTDFLTVENRKILIFFREYQQELIMIIANLSRFPQYVELDLQKYDGYSLIEMFSGERFPSIGTLPYFLTLGAYGYYWFSLEKQQERSVAEQLKHERERQINEITYQAEAEKIFLPQERHFLEGIIRKYLFKRSWFLPLVPQLDKTKITCCDLLRLDTQQKIHLVFIEIVLITGITNYIPLFLTLYEEERGKERLTYAENVVALLKGKESDTVIFDSGQENFISQVLLEFVEREKKQKSEQGQLRGVCMHHFEGPKTLKIFSILEEKMDPDIEMRSCLVQNTNFRAFYPLMGYLEYSAPNKTTVALAEIVEMRPSKYNAKENFVEAAERFLQQMETLQEPLDKEILVCKHTFITLALGKVELKVRELLEEQPEVAREVGKTLADFHFAVYSVSHPDFTPLPYTLFYQRSLLQIMRRKINEAFARLKRLEQFAEMLPLKEKLLKFMGRFPSVLLGLARMRIHGNFVLENLSYTGKEILITHFGGDLSLSLVERRYKRSALRDVAAMLFSIADASFEAIEKLKHRGLIADHDLQRYTQWAHFWAIWIGTSFLRAYLRKLKNAPFLPKSHQEIDFIVGIFLLERCLEEIADPEISKIEAACYTLQQWLPIYEEIQRS